MTVLANLENGDRKPTPPQKNHTNWCGFSVFTKDGKLSSDFLQKFVTFLTKFRTFCVS